MYKIKENNIEMFEGDYGEILPITIIEGDVLEGDVLKMVIQDLNHHTIIDKTLTKNRDKFEFSLTSQETEKLKDGKYLWGLKQYREGLLIDTLSGNNEFKVTKGQ